MTKALLQWHELPQAVRDYFAIVGKAAENIFDINWKKHFPNFDFSHPSGIAKAKGMLVGYRNHKGRQFFEEFGELPDPEKSREFLEKKFDFITQNSKLPMSLLGRKPEAGVYAGANGFMRDGHLEMTGVTGFPDPVDHCIDQTGREVVNLKMAISPSLDNTVKGMFQTMLEAHGIDGIDYYNFADEIDDILEHAADLTFS